MLSSHWMGGWCGDANEAICHGYIATFVAVLAYGSFGVPIKQTKQYNVHPLVLQSYKTVSLFMTCWLVIPIFHVQPQWTSWGLVSGILWVLGGTCGIYGIRNAGLAIAVGTWASIMILCNFIWGILIFHEPIANISSTIGALVCLTLGVIGMSYYSTTTTSTTTTTRTNTKSSSKDAAPAATTTTMNDDFALLNGSDSNGIGDYNDQEEDLESGELVDIATTTTTTPSMTNNTYEPNSSSSSSSSLGLVHRRISQSTTTLSLRPAGITVSIPPQRRKSGPSQRRRQEQQTRNGDTKNDTPSNNRWSKQRLGIASSILNGILTGSSLFPIHYAKRHGFGGPNYLISLAAGSMVANTIVWIIYFFVNCGYYLIYIHNNNNISRRHTSSNTATSAVVTNHSGNVQTKPMTWDTAKGDVDNVSRDSFGRGGDNRDGCRDYTGDSIFQNAWAMMPSWYLRELWVPGFTAGAIFSVGMFCSVISITNLGQAIGNSIIQLKILVSGLWGIFWYKEIRGCVTITKWFASASLAVLGIVWLSLERLAAKEGKGS